MFPNINVNVVPANLKTALARSNPDQKVWGTSYNKEYDGLNSLNVFTKITAEQYRDSSSSSSSSSSSMCSKVMIEQVCYTVVVVG